MPEPETINVQEIKNAILFYEEQRATFVANANATITTMNTVIQVLQELLKPKPVVDVSDEAVEQMNSLSRTVDKVTFPV